VLPGEERQLRTLRRWLASLLPECAARDDVIAVATELSSNAIKHTASGQGGCFGVEVTWHESVIRVTVADRGAAQGPQVIQVPMAEHGRGLLVVSGLAARSGVCGDAGGRQVWADIPWDGPVTGFAEPPQGVCEGPGWPAGQL
jgi:anti-sigma regulatory factor (Ser/Thr protein kinase)